MWHGHKGWWQEKFSLWEKKTVQLKEVYTVRCCIVSSNNGCANEMETRSCPCFKVGYTRESLRVLATRQKLLRKIIWMNRQEKCSNLSISCYHTSSCPFENLCFSEKLTSVFVSPFWMEILEPFIFLSDFGECSASFQVLVSGFWKHLVMSLLKQTNKQNQQILLLPPPLF